MYFYLAWAFAVLGTVFTLLGVHFFDKHAHHSIEEANLKSERGIADAKLGASQAHERAAELEKQASQLRSDNLILERSMAPRRWYGPLAGSHLGGATATQLFSIAETNSDLLKFSRTPVLIQTVPDFEAEKLAAHITRGLLVAGWQTQTLKTDLSGIPTLAIPDGVQIWTRSTQDSAWKAAAALAESLSLEGIEAEEAGAKLHRDDPSAQLFPEGDIRKSPPENTVVILIGQKPGFFRLLGKLGDAYRANHPGEK
jgi:hypothetical protein